MNNHLGLWYNDIIPNTKNGQLTREAEYTRKQCGVEYLIVYFHIVAFK